ncbi:Cu-processing system permease protein [Ferrimonas sediminum]|uniref:Cu-processing system permease protein n=1 Tax=Ferrimonas sediminum TaxID=718193 RepID=A0A1G8Z7M7_9GAMM|nr:ABC transporter permease subunit [Ferrimonas sediminum]SDK10973.1 Cu-processing system permease protein [Ferrimonas sediminum]
MSSPVLIVAHKEFIDGFRHRWLLFASLIFALLSLAVAFLGSAVNGQLVAPQLAPTISALATLAAFMIPLIALLLGHDSFVGEQEGGTLLLLLSYPISRGQLLLGKFIGQGAILAVTCLLGFGVTAIAMGVTMGAEQASAVMSAFVLFITSATLLSWVFLLLSYLVSLWVSTKGRAVAVGLLLWFLLVLLYDLVLLAMIVAEGGELWVKGLILANPVDLFRLSNLLYVGHDSVVGVLSVVTASSFSFGLMLLLMLAWLSLGLVATRTLFQTRAI